MVSYYEWADKQAGAAAPAELPQDRIASMIREAIRDKQAADATGRHIYRSASPVGGRL